MRNGGGFSARLALLLTTVVGINVGYTAVLPFLPQFADRLGLGPAGITLFLVGFPIAKIVAQPLGGRLADRLGLRAAGTLGLVLAVIGMVIVARSHAAYPAILGRLVWGAADGIVSPALYGAVTTLSAEHGRDPARGYAKLGAAAVLSFAGGPALAGLVHSFAGYPPVLTAVAGLTLLNAAVAWRVLPGRGGAEPSATEAGAQAPDRPLLLALFGGIDLCANVLWAATEVLVPLTLARTVGDPVGRSAWLLSTGMVVFAVASPLLARLPGRWRRPRSAVLGLAVLGAGCLALSALTVPAAGLLAIAVFMTAQAYLYLIAREGVQRYCGGAAQAWGVFGMFSDTGFLAGPAVGVALFQIWGTAAFPVLGVASMLAAAAVPAALRGRRAAVPTELT